jgi:outer membrane protein
LRLALFEPLQAGGVVSVVRAGFYIVLFTCSGNAPAADLLDVFRQAQRADSTYAAARSTWAAAQERIPQARAGLLPLASLTATAQNTDRSVNVRDNGAPPSDARFTSTGLTLSVTQPLYRKQNTVAYEQAMTQAQQADAQLALAAQDLILRTAQAYFDVLLAADNIALAESQKVAIGQQLEQAKRNFEVGTATITDTHEAQARYDLTTAQEIAARNDFELRRRALEQVIARTAPPLAPLGPAFALKPPQPVVMQSWVDLARQSNLQVRIAQSAATFAQQEIARNRAGHLPTLDAFATVASAGTGAGTTGGFGNDTRTTSVGVQLTLPLYQGGAVSSRVREAIANETRAGDELESARRGAEFNARQAFLGITSGIAQVQALEAALLSTESQLDSTRLGREVGVRTQVDVLNAQQLLFSARRDLAQSRYSYVLSLLRLEAAIGELTEDDLGAINGWLGPVHATAGAVPSPYIDLSRIERSPTRSFRGEGAAAHPAKPPAQRTPKPAVNAVTASNELAERRDSAQPVPEKQAPIRASQERS